MPGADQVASPSLPWQRQELVNSYVDFGICSMPPVCAWYNKVEVNLKSRYLTLDTGESILLIW
jgi:hypothetical protein